jgi:RNA polymerase sigma factor (sigma-70 family)
MSRRPGHRPPGRAFAGRLTPQEFDELFVTWYQPVVSQAFLICGGRLQPAQDAAQEAFVTCWRRLADPTSPEVGNWPAWLRVTAAHHAIAALKKEAGERNLDVEGLDRAGHQVDPAVLVDLKDAFRRVCEHLARLSIRRREVMVRVALGGQSVKETAAVMGISEATVRVHVSRARQALEPVWADLTSMGVFDGDEGSS